MTKSIEFYFDFSSPYAYLGFKEIKKYEKKYPFQIKYMPIFLGGLHNSDLIIIAGRPSMGKTALATNIGFNAAKFFSQEEDKGSVVMFSLEMSAEQLASRVIAEQTKISSDSIRKGSLTDEEYTRLFNTAKELQTLPLYIDHT